MLRPSRRTGALLGSAKQEVNSRHLQRIFCDLKTDASPQPEGELTKEQSHGAVKVTRPQSNLQQQQQQHWLDQYFPGVRQWLENKNRDWWIKGLVEARGKQYHQLEGRKDILRSSIELQYSSLHQRHADLAVDDRSETHLQVACLAIATYRVLMPFLRDEQEVLGVIGEHMGGRTSPALSFLMKAVKFLHRDPYATLSGRLGGLQRDYGAGFETDLQVGDSQATLIIHSCFYHRLYEREGLPQLMACSCCSQDQVWLEGVQYKGVEAGLESSKARGDPCCRFRVWKVGGRGEKGG